MFQSSTGNVGTTLHLPGRGPLSPPMQCISKYETNSWDKSSSSVSLIKPSIMSLTGRNVCAFQPGEIQLSNQKLSTSYLSFKTKMLKEKYLDQEMLA